MTRHVLFVPKRELFDQFDENLRRDLKVVTPLILTEEAREKLKIRNKDPKPGAAVAEARLDGQIWRHSRADEPNWICEASEFFHDLDLVDSMGLFAIAFAVEGSLEECHVHDRHIEIYFSEHKLRAKYRLSKEGDWEDSPPEMVSGGLMVFGPGVAHKIWTSGLTFVVEVPAIRKDRRPVDEQ